MDRSYDSRRTYLVCAFLVGTTLAAFWPVLHNSFVNYDDPSYVTENPWVQNGFSWATVKWAFTTNHAGNWHPLTWLTHAIDFSLYGLKPLGHHFTNLLLHIANTLLLFFVLRRLTGAFWRSAMVAALFGLHPLHVESVAWVSERKDVLSGFFFLLTLLAYERYVRAGARAVPGSQQQQSEKGLEGGPRRNEPSDTLRAGDGSRSDASRSDAPPSTTPPLHHTTTPTFLYLLSLLFFACGLMSKPMLVTVPCLLLLLDFWPLGRFQSLHVPRSLLLEKLPFFALSAASCVVTFIIQRNAGATTSLEVLPLEFRIPNALISYVRYAGKLIWPSGLAAFYPAPRQWPIEITIGATLLLAAVTAMVIWRGKKSPYLPVGWFWFLGSLVPVIGIIQVGQQAMADRYMYLPAIGLLLMLVWRLSELLSDRVPALRSSDAVAAQRSPTPALPFVVSIVVLLIFAGLTFVQSGYWRNTVTLFTHALAVTENNAVAHNNLGANLIDSGDIPAAETHFAEAVRIQPRNGDALANLALCRDKEGQTQQAMELFTRAIEAQPTAVAHYNFANVLAKQKNYPEAEVHYRAALEKRPEFVEGWHNFGIMEAAQGKSDVAENCFRTALRLRPGYVDARLNLGILLVGQHKVDQGIAEFKTAIQLAPNNADAHFDLASAWNTKGDFAQAAAEFAEAARLRPNDLEARANSAQALMNQGKIAEAMQQFDEIIRLNPTPQAHYGLALALDARSQPQFAVIHYREAIRLDTNNPAYPNDLAWLLATCAKPEIRDGAEAVRLAELACRLSGGKEARFWGTLDAAYAEAGRFDDAAATAIKARDLAVVAGQKEVAQAAEERLTLYRSKRPYHTAMANSPP